jgi:hypothetical protein
VPADVLAHTVGVGAVGSRPVAVAHGRDISSVGDEAFGEQKPLGQLDIRARRVHGHRQWSSADPALEGASATRVSGRAAHVAASMRVIRVRVVTRPIQDRRSSRMVTALDTGVFDPRAT